MSQRNRDAYAWIDESLQVIHRANWHRSVKDIEGTAANGAEILIKGQRLINFASNDYLGFASHPALKAAAIAAIQTDGTGATGSRLLSGQRPIHRELEEAIAQWKQTESALVFSSGYLANLSTIQAIVGAKDLILADVYNHSSLKNGAKLSGAAVIEFGHCSIQDLRAKLERDRTDYRRCLITTDSVFSMDGDLCPIPELIDLAQEFDAMLLVDEAHATGVIGTNGSGSVEHFGKLDTPLIQVGTLSKALGSLGGYVAGSHSLIEFLRNRGAGWIYTTGLTPSDCSAALAAVKLCQANSKHLQSLWQNITQLQHQLSTVIQKSSITSISLLASDSAIRCLEVDKPLTALNLSHRLREKGCFVPAIRPPTVPTSRLRISLMATHTSDHIQTLITAMTETLNRS
jgi:8-amino-7-oxononanoate synthase